MASADGPASQPAKEKLLLVDACVQRFERAWQSGGRPAMDDFLPQDGSDRLAVLKELVKVDMERRLAEGEPARAEDYLDRYPELAAYLHPTQVLESSLQQVIAGRAAPPQQIGRYRVEKALGQGGFGVVYLAHDDQLSRPVAIKVPHPKFVARPEDAEAYLTEARIVAGLDHPNIVPVYDVGNTEDCPFFVVSKFIEGGTLTQRIKKGRPSVVGATELVASVAETLHYAHKKGLVHRDIKPGNILLEWHGDNQSPVPYVADFGLALREADFGKGAGITGTPAYLSPEQARGEGHRVDGRSDIFSLGVVFYELLTGRRPFHADSVDELLDQIRSVDVRPPRQRNDAIPSELERICLKALSKQVSDRYTTTKDMADDLRHFLEQATEEEKLILRSTIPATGTTSGALRQTPARLRPVLWILAAALALGGLLIGRLWEGPPPSRGTGQIQSIAVLSFENLSRDPKQEYFSDGMTEALTTDLAGVGALRVISRASVLTYKDTNKSLPQIAKELKVDAVVHGSVLLVGDQVRINARLIEAATDSHLWAESYDRHVDDVLALQKEVAQGIVREIKVKLNAQEQARLAEVPRVLPAAYQAYLKGRYFWNKRTEQDLKTAISHFTEANDTDPTYAPAWAGLADCYNFLGYGNYLSPKESFPKGEAAAARARDLDPKLADAYASLGYVRMYYHWNFLEAEKAFRRAIELNPNSATAHHLFSIYLTAMRRDDEARRTIERAQTLDPLSVPVTTDMGFELHYMGQDNEAIRQLRAALVKNPKFPLAHFWLGRIYTMQERYDQAFVELEAVDHALRQWQPMMAARGYLYGVWGKRKEAQAVLDDFEALRTGGRFVTSYGVALVYTALGDNEQAFAWLERACDERSHWLVWLALDPRWERLRSDPRFSELLRRVGLP